MTPGGSEEGNFRRPSAGIPNVLQQSALVRGQGRMRQRKVNSTAPSWLFCDVSPRSPQRAESPVPPAAGSVTSTWLFAEFLSLNSCCALPSSEPLCPGSHPSWQWPTSNDWLITGDKGLGFSHLFKTTQDPLQPQSCLQCQRRPFWNSTAGHLLRLPSPAPFLPHRH